MWVVGYWRLHVLVGFPSLPSMSRTQSPRQTGWQDETIQALNLSNIWVTPKLPTFRHPNSVVRPRLHLAFANALSAFDHQLPSYFYGPGSMQRAAQ